MAKTEVVIAHYDKPLDWIAGLKDCRITVYAKGPEPPDIPEGVEAHVIELENISHEDFAILWHILNRWDSLADVTIPLHDDADNSGRHCTGDLVARINEGFEELDEALPLGEVPFCGPDGSCSPKVPLKEIYEELLERPFPAPPERGEIDFARSAFLAIPRQKIKQRGREFYARAMEILKREADPNRPQDRRPDFRPWATTIFERLWLEIFKGVPRELVVARYKEDLGWLKEHEGPIRVYNHGEPLGDLPPGWTEVMLPNIGREAHCYLTHIVERYDSLADLTVFLHGDANIDRPPAKHNAAGIRKVLLDGLPVDKFHPFTRGVSNCWDKAAVGRWRKQLIGDSESGDLGFYPGAMFAVPRQIIQRRDRAFYEKCLAAVVEENEVDGLKSGGLAYVFERLWDLIFKTDGGGDGWEA